MQVLIQNDKKLIVLIFLLTSNLIICRAQQNLVPNSGFEILNSCPHSSGEIFRLYDWYSASGGSPDCYNLCYDTTYINGNVGVPANYNGNELPHTGNGYVGIVVGTVANFREYIEVELTDSLLSGKRYLFEMYVSLSDSSWYSNNSIGAFLSDISLSSPSTLNLSFTPQLNNQVGNNLNDKNGWILVQDTFIANGGEKYLIIGNFNPDSLSDTHFVGSGGISTGYFTSYYYLDDISLTLDTTTSVKEFEDIENHVEVWPSPFGNDLQIKWDQKMKFPVQVLIYNSIGSLELSQSILIHQADLKLGNLPSGVHYVVISSAGHSPVCRKVVKLF